MKDPRTIATMIHKESAEMADQGYTYLTNIVDRSRSGLLRLREETPDVVAEFLHRVKDEPHVSRLFQDAIRHNMARLSVLTTDARKIIDRYSASLLEELATTQSRVTDLAGELNSHLATLLSRTDAGFDIPFTGYESMTAREIIARIPTLPVKTLKSIESFEKSHSQRISVIRAATRMLEQH